MTRTAVTIKLRGRRNFVEFVCDDFGLSLNDFQIVRLVSFLLGLVLFGFGATTQTESESPGFLLRRLRFLSLGSGWRTTWRWGGRFWWGPPLRLRFDPQLGGQSAPGFVQLGRAGGRWLVDQFLGFTRFKAGDASLWLDGFQCVQDIFFAGRSG